MKRLPKFLMALAALVALALGGAAIAGAVSDTDRPDGEAPAQQDRPGLSLAAEDEDDEGEDDEGEDDEGEDDEDDGPEEAADDAREQAGGPQAERAKRAALEATRGGRADAVERDSEHGGTWEVEVSRRDGSTVEVRLGDSYEVVEIEDDSE